MIYTLTLLLCTQLAGLAGCVASPVGDPAISPPATAEEPHAPVVVAYLPDYRIDGVDVDAFWLKPVTDLIYFSLTVPDNGVFEADAIDPQHLEKLKTLQQKSDSRLLLCIGGWGRSDGFAAVAADPAKRSAMIDSLAALCQTHGFDGIDYDWEHPENQEQLRHYALLIEETATHFADQGLLVTVAQAGWQDLTSQAYDALDRVHLMSYDHDYPHATLEKSKQDVERLINWGCPPGKIALGIPFYGRNHDRRARTYADLANHADLDPAADRHDGFAFNGPATVGLKTEYALERGLAGVMVWEITQDHQKDQTLLRAIHAVLASKATAFKETHQAENAREK